MVQKSEVCARHYWPYRERLMDYRELLIKYINHVGDSEGTVFLGYQELMPDYISADEYEELKRLDAESKKYHKFQIKA